VGVKNCSRSDFVDDCQMELRFGTGFTSPIQHLLELIHDKQLFGLQAAFVDSAWCHQQQNGVLLHHNTEISAGPVTPTPPMQFFNRFRQSFPYHL
tara:strand:- start:265 stop:549 length:285 start_codon:yes stop_codon:yes gene_type:complete